MNTTLPAIALGALLMALAGCASAPKSKAYQIAEAGEIHHALRDVPADKLPQGWSNLDTFSDTFANTSDAFRSLSVLSGYTTPPPGISPGVDIAFSLLRIAERGAQAYLARRGACFAWMPRHLYPDPAAATKALRTELLATAIESLPEGFEMEEEITIKERPFGQAPQKIITYRVRGGACDGRDCAIRLFLARANKGQTNAPDLLGGYPAYTWTKIRCGFSLAFKQKGETNIAPPFDVLAYYQRVSQSLPEWLYLYVPPEYGVIPIPIMLNQGKPLFFIQPTKQASVSP